MPGDDFQDILNKFQQALAECRELYRTSGDIAFRELGPQLAQSREKFIELMDDLHAALLLKVFVAVGQCDRAWSKTEQGLAAALIEHLWGRRLEGQRLRDAIREMADKAITLNWYALVRPFDQLAPLRNRVSELESLVVRVCHLVARADGAIRPVETSSIRSVQEEIRRHLRPIPIDEPTEHAAADHAAKAAVDSALQSAERLPARASAADAARPP